METRVNDLLLIYHEQTPLAYARVEDISADVKPGWWQLSMLLLQLPMQQVTWILREEYIDGGGFVMGGQNMRLERLPGNARRDAELAGQVKPFASAVRQLAAQVTVTHQRPELEQLRWMTEELRVSLYAQELKTAVRVSEKHLAEQLEKARLEARG